MAKPTKKHWRVEVLWHDSTILEGGWRTREDILSQRSVVECTSVGFVIADDKKGMVVASSIHGQQAMGVMVIPRRQVVKVRRLR